MGFVQHSSLVREMYVCSCDWLPGIKYYKQADVEKSFFGSGQGETTEFGADQCKHSFNFLSCINHSTQVYLYAMMLQGTNYGRSLETVSLCQILCSSASCSPDLSLQDPV